MEHDDLRTALIQRISDLSDDELQRIGPYLEADLDSLADLDDLHREIALGLESERNEPLIDHDEVMDDVLARLASRQRKP